MFDQFTLTGAEVDASVVNSEDEDEDASDANSEVIEGDGVG